MIGQTRRGVEVVFVDAIAELHRETNEGKLLVHDFSETEEVRE
jgi:hypothetical protein